MLRAATKGAGRAVLEPLFHLRQYRQVTDRHNKVVAPPTYGPPDGGGVTFHLGEFPANAITEALLAGRRVAVCRCGKFFSPRRRGHRFCRPACRERGSRKHYARERRATRREREAAVLVALRAAVKRTGYEWEEKELWFELPAERGRRLTFYVAREKPALPNHVAALTFRALWRNPRAQAAIRRLAAHEAPLRAALGQVKPRWRYPPNDSSKR